MPEVNDAWDAIFLGCFLFGLLFSVVAVFVGGFDGDGGGEADGLVPVNPSTVLAFLGWFGGVGYLAREGAGWPTFLSVVVGAVGGLVGALAIAWFLVKVVRPNDRALDPKDFRLPGTIARVTSSIRAGGTGEVTYEQAGVRQVAAARAADGRAIARGAEVVVVRAERGVALVEPSAAFFGEELPPPVEVGTHPVSPSGT